MAIRRKLQIRGDLSCLQLKGLKLVSPGFYHAWCDYNLNVDPIDLLKFFRFADGIVTDTFHGCVMSIITNSSFVVKTRASNYNKLYNLLGEYSLSNRMISDFHLAILQSIFEQKIDWLNVNQEVERRRKESMSFLNDLIKLSNE